MNAERYVYLDIETTGLDPHRHEIVELAWAVGDGRINVVRPRHTLRFADPQALRINRYHERGLGQDPSSADEISRFLLDARGRTVVGANPTFDANFLIAHFGFAPWHFRLLDIEAFAQGVLGCWSRPPSLKTIREALVSLGHDIPVPDHSAAADVATCRAAMRALRFQQLITLVSLPHLLELKTSLSAAVKEAKAAAAAAG